MPNSQEFDFRYNQYGELARVTIPAGGKFEYDWLPYTAPFTPMGGGAMVADGVYGGLMVYRRVHERRVYSSAATGANPDRKTVYDVPLLAAGGANLTVTATEEDGSGAPLRKTVSTFWGTPLSSSAIAMNGYPGWREGKLYWEERRKTDDTPLQRTTNTWMNRRLSDSASVDPGTEQAQPNDPRITQVDRSAGECDRNDDDGVFAGCI